jgi:hypothetical protein
MYLLILTELLKKTTFNRINNIKFFAFSRAASISEWKKQFNSSAFWKPVPLKNSLASR